LNGVQFNKGVTTVTWKITDVALNTSNCSFTFTVNDNTKPVFVGCPGNITLQTGAGNATCLQTASWTAPTVTDNCPDGGSTALTSTHTPGSSFAVGTTTVTYTATDGSGNTQTCSFTVTVSDNTVPTISCIANQTRSANGSCNYVASSTEFDPASSGDNCSGPIRSYSLTGVTTATNVVANTLNGITFNKGATTVTWKITDAAGNIATCNFTVSINDTQSPTIVCKADQIRSATASCNYVAALGEFDPVSSGDNCSGSFRSYSLSGATSATDVIANSVNGVIFNKGITTVTWKVTDGAANVTTCSFTVTVNDNILPTISCPGNKSKAAGINCTYAAVGSEFDPTASGDNCSGAVNSYSLTGATTATNVVANTLNGVLFNKGVTTVTWKITDASGNIATCSFTVTVSDSQLPTIACVGNQSRSAGITCTYTPSAGEFDPASSGDNCPGAITSYSLTGATSATNIVASTLNGVSFNKGITTVTWKITDASGNIANCSFTVTVSDNTPPSIVCPGNQSVNVNSSCIHVAASGEFDPVSSADNCSGAIRSYSLTGATTATNVVANTLNGINFNKGITTVTWKITDAAGNVATCSFTVTVNDNLPPTISCAGNKLRNAGINCTYVSSGSEFDPLSFGDNCSGTVNSYSLSGATTASNIVASTLNGVSLNKGVTTVTWKITDASGNSATCSFTVTVSDNTNPTIVCAGNQVRNAGLNCTYSSSTGEFDPVSSGDNCVGIVTSYSLTGATSAFDVLAGTLDGVVFNKGITTVSWKITDAAGNIANCSFTVTVSDNTLPTIVCVGNQSVSTNSGCAYVSSSGEFDPVSFGDNCAGALTSYTLSGATVATNVIANTLNGILMNKGVTGVTWKITDASGNIATCSFTITVLDNTPPTIVCPGNLSRGTNSSCNYASTSGEFDPVSSGDNCPGSFRSYSLSGVTNATNVIANSLNSVVFNRGITTVTWKVTDASGNFSTSSFDLTISENQLPTIICSGNQTRYANVNCSYTPAAGELDPASVTGSCSGYFLTYSLGGTGTATNVIANTLNGVTFGLGFAKITWMITDGSGNTQTCSFNLNVVDNTKPSVTCQSNITVTPNVPGCMASATIPPPLVTDCSLPASIMFEITGAGASGPTNGATSVGSRNFNTGTTIITYTVTDAAGNTQTCPTSLTVINPLLGSVSGTITATQNSSTTTSVNFVAEAGSAPYAFSYSLSVNGANAATYNVTASGTNTATIFQSNSSAGIYVYRLLGLTDLYGCPGTVSSQNMATVIVTSGLQDFTPTVDISSLGFSAGGPGRDFIVNINEISRIAPSVGALQFRVIKPSAFNITYGLVNGISNILSPVSNNNSDWNFTENSSFITATLKPLKQINANSFSRIGFTLHRKPGVGNNTTQNLTVIIVNGSGGDSNPNNNTSNTIITAQ